MPKSYGNTSIPRLRYLWLIATIVAGFGLVWSIWNSKPDVGIDALRTYAGTLTSAAASMSALAFAGAGLLYAILSLSMIKTLHDAGALNRVVFDLLACAGLWLLSLGSALLASMPFFNHIAVAIIASSTFAVAGIFYFAPLGYAFWLLLTNGSKEVAPVIEHDWTTPTELNPIDPPSPNTQ